MQRFLVSIVVVLSICFVQCSKKDSEDSINGSQEKKDSIIDTADTAVSLKDVEFRDNCIEGVCFSCDLNEEEEDWYQSLLEAYKNNDSEYLQTYFSDWHAGVADKETEEDTLTAAVKELYLQYNFGEMSDSKGYSLVEEDKSISVDTYFNADSLLSLKNNNVVKFTLPKNYGERKFLYLGASEEKVINCFVGEDDYFFMVENQDRYDLLQDSVRSRRGYIDSEGTYYTNDCGPCGFSFDLTALSFNSSMDSVYYTVHTDVLNDVGLMVKKEGTWEVLLRED